MALANGDHGATRSLLTALLDAGLEVETPWLFVDHCLVADDRALADRAAAAYRSDAATRHATSPDHITLERAADDALAGRLAEADGDLEVARDRYERAWRTFAEYGWDTPAGMVRGWLGRCLLDQGEVTAAVEQLQAGRHLATTLGLAAVIVEIDANLARAGVEPLIA